MECPKCLQMAARLDQAKGIVRCNWDYVSNEIESIQQQVQNLEIERARVLKLSADDWTDHWEINSVLLELRDGFRDLTRRLRLCESTLQSSVSKIVTELSSPDSDSGEEMNVE